MVAAAVAVEAEAEAATAATTTGTADEVAVIAGELDDGELHAVVIGRSVRSPCTRVFSVVFLCFLRVCRTDVLEADMRPGGVAGSNMFVALV